MNSGPITAEISYNNDAGNHVVMLDKVRKFAIGLYVADARNSVGKVVKIADAVIKSNETCAIKVYTTYKISDISPYENGWSYVELDVDSVLFLEPPPFTAIPISKAKKRDNLRLQATIGSVWTDGVKTWVIRDLCEEILYGNKRTRVWITDNDGKRGQAVYLDSIIDKYTIVP